jgi:hypothetical protein
VVDRQANTKHAVAARTFPNRGFNNLCACRREVVAGLSVIIWRNNSGRDLQTESEKAVEVECFLRSFMGTPLSVALIGSCPGPDTVYLRTPDKHLARINAEVPSYKKYMFQSGSVFLRKPIPQTI